MYLAKICNSMIIEIHEDLFWISQTQKPQIKKEMGHYNSNMAITV